MRLEGVLELEFERIISLVGGGGKSSIMYYLAEQLNKQGNILVTTTTKIYLPELDKIDALIMATTLEQLLEELRTALKREEDQVIVIGNDVDDGKLIGIPSEWVEVLADEFEGIKHILVEADGARRRPFKLPREDEPVIPINTTKVLLVVGASVIGKEFNDEYVYRAELAKGVFEQEAIGQVTPEIIAEIICREECYGKLKNSSYQVIPIINQVDDKIVYNQACSLAKILREESFEKVLLTSLELFNPLVEVFE